MPRSCSSAAPQTENSKRTHNISSSTWVCGRSTTMPKRRSGTARENSPRKASRYRKEGLSINNPVRLHSPKDQAPVHRENSPSQKKVIPDSSKRVKIGVTKARIIPRARRTIEKNRENPISENRCIMSSDGLPNKRG